MRLIDAEHRDPSWITPDEVADPGFATEAKRQEKAEDLTISKTQTVLRHIDTQKHCQIAADCNEHDTYAWEWETRWELNLLV
jgi:hypothetical protein